MQFRACKHEGNDKLILFFSCYMGDKGTNAETNSEMPD